ncbi:MAG TPA: YigZ family protein [Candidatus Cloacimonadota bacterium]|nr:YigZ family protein [Candidatus Cloacimonadota bacterium]
MAGIHTLSELCIYEEKIKRSRFIAHLCPAQSMEEVRGFISAISTEHSTANHNCWAYILGDKAEIEHASDQGEPPGTAGKPMLNMLKKHELSNVVAVVTRYFGGTKLGIPGLIDAYSHIVDQAIQRASIIPLVHIVEFQYVVNYQNHDLIKHRIIELGAMNLEEEYTEIVTTTFTVLEESEPAVETYLAEMSKISKIENWEKNKD